MRKHWAKVDQLMVLYWLYGYDIDIFPVANSLFGNWKQVFERLSYDFISHKLTAQHYYIYGGQYGKECQE